MMGILDTKHSLMRVTNVAMTSSCHFPRSKRMFLRRLGKSDAAHKRIVGDYLNEAQSPGG